MAHTAAGRNRRRTTAARSTLPWSPLIAVVAVTVALVFGWGLIARQFTNAKPVVAGTVLPLRPGGELTAAFVIPGNGWTLQRAESDPRHGYRLRHGDITVTVAGLTLPPTRTSTKELWTGLGRLARLEHADLGPAQPVTAERGAAGQSGSWQIDNDTGTATVYRSPDGDTAVEVITRGPPEAPDADWAAAEQIARTVSFAGGRS